MNKIEYAIEDCQSQIDRLELERIMVQVELDAYKKQLDNLERIRDNKSIPHDDTPTTIMKGGDK
jgi:hypothetical protein